MTATKTKQVVSTPLIYSPYDEDEYGKGYYFEERALNTSGKWRTSQLFASKSEARQALRDNKIIWDN